MNKSVSKLSVVPSTRPSPLVQLVEDYLADARASGLSPKTIKYGYGWPLREVFLPWAADNQVDSVDQLTSRVLNRFSAHLADVGGKNGKLKVASIWTYSKAVSRLLKWAKADGEKVEGSIKLPKLPKTVVEILSPQEVTKLEDGAVSERDKLIVRLLFDSGMRRNELCQLTTRDLIVESGQDYLVVHGKGGRDRKTPITPKMARRIRRYTAGRAGTTRIFLGLKRRPGGDVEPLTDSGVTQMITALGQRVLDRKVWPHLFRHSMIMNARRRGMDPLLVAQVAGHTSLQMMSRFYDHATPSDAAAALMQVLRAEE